MISDADVQKRIATTLDQLPADWLRLTTHRLDIYNEKLAKVEFLEKFENLREVTTETLNELPTAFDYIRLGHPLSCILEWALAKSSKLSPDGVISFSSQVMPLMSVLRTNQRLKKKTRLLTTGWLPTGLSPDLVRSVYSYDLQVEEVDDFSEASEFDGSTLVINGPDSHSFDFDLVLFDGMGSVLKIFNGKQAYIKEALHVRRRESIAMTPQNCLEAIKRHADGSIDRSAPTQGPLDHLELQKTIQSITQTTTDVCLASSGLSVQYAIMMGLVEHANENHGGKNIHFIVPPNCYGGTNDQARRVAACINNVKIVDLPVDGGKDMVTELQRILDTAAEEDAVPYVIAEIPTNPRVEIPDLEKLRETLKSNLRTKRGDDAVKPVFILDQTFCPNVVFFGESGHLHDTIAVSYVSGSKFPSGGLCTAGYAVFNDLASAYQPYVKRHLSVCDNEATLLQLRILKEEMPSMNNRIARAYENTRTFVDFIQELMPEVKINFVSSELAEAGFTPSVFSLDLPTTGQTDEEKQATKHKANHKLIKMMIERIPEESKHCVSYGQLKGCYWTIPATSTQGTTKESDKDYIVRVSVAPDFDLEKHQVVFKDFVQSQ